jgi:DNA-binding CsgD family transcriptional regulator
MNIQVEPAYRAPGMMLTKRERQIVALLIKGEHTSTIAEILQLSPHTVSTHRKNILAKTKVKSTAELASLALKEGWV